MFDKYLLSRRLSCGRHFDLEERLREYCELDARHNEIKEGDIIEVHDGVYNIEVSEGLNSVIEKAVAYVEEYKGADRLSRYMKFIKKYCISDYSKDFDYNFYKGNALSLSRLIEKDALNSVDSTVLLSVILNSDLELKICGFKSYCVSGEMLHWGKISPTLAIKLQAENETFLLMPSEGKLERITGIALPGSLNGGFVEAYTSIDTHKLLMIVKSSRLFRKGAQETQ